MSQTLTSDPGLPPLTIPMPRAKHGLYPLTADDLIVSVPLFETILRTLEHGTPDDRQRLAASLRAMLDAPFA